MNKKNTKSGGLKSIKGGKGGHHGEDPTVPNGNTIEAGPTVLGPSKVIDFASVRAQRNLDNRRNFERFVLRHMIDVYCEIDGGAQQLPLEIVEVSESGCSFRLPTDQGKVLPRDTMGEIVPLQFRFYFSRDSYLRVGLFVVNSTRDIGNGGSAIRFGCKIDESFASAEAYRQFVRFMEQFAKHALSDSKQVSGY